MIKKEVQWLIIGLAVIFLLLALCVGYGMFIHEKPKVAKPNIPTQPTQPELNDTSNWQTYRNEAYGFEVKFPDTWKGYKILSKQTKTAVNPDSGEEYTFIFLRFYHSQTVSNKGRPGEICFDIGIFDNKNFLIAGKKRSLGRKNLNIFTTWPCNSAVPDDMHERYEEISLITKTFKFLD